MSQNERKTWIMYKRALRPVYFSENIFPTMNKSCQIDKYTSIVEDSYGFWKAHANTPYAYQTDIPPVWRAFDKSTGTHTKVMYYKTSFSESIITLTLPEGVQICPHNMTATVAMMSSGTVEGYNPLTNAWEKIFTIGKSYLDPVIHKYNNDANTTYYTAFRVRSKQYNSSNKVMYLYELTCDAGYILPSGSNTKHFTTTNFKKSILPQFAEISIDGTTKLAGEAPYGYWTLVNNAGSGGTFTDALNVFDYNNDSYCVFTNRGTRNLLATFTITLPKGVFMSVNGAQASVGTASGNHTIYLQGYNYGGGAWETLTNSLKFVSDNTPREFTMNDTLKSNYYNLFRVCIYDISTTTLSHDVNIHDFQITSGTLKYYPELA